MQKEPCVKSKHHIHHVLAASSTGPGPLSCSRDTNWKKYEKTKPINITSCSAAHSAKSWRGLATQSESRVTPTEEGRPAQTKTVLIK